MNVPKKRTLPHLCISTVLVLVLAVLLVPEYVTHADGPFSIDSDLTQLADVTGPELDTAIRAIRPDSPLIGLGQTFVDVGRKHGINAFYIAAHAAWESTWGTSPLARDKNNLFGYGAYNRCPYKCAWSFANKADSVEIVMAKIKAAYLTPGGKYYHGATLRGMNVKYAIDQNWKYGIASIMNSLQENARKDTERSTRCRGNPISLERTAHGTLSDNVEQENYCFKVSDRQAISIRMFDTDDANPTLDTMIGLYDEAGHLVASNDDGPGIGTNSFLSVYLPSGGIYLIAAMRYGNSSGNYWLRLEDGAQAAPGDVNRDCVVNDHDAQLIKATLGKSNASADIDLNGNVNTRDLIFCLRNEGTQCNDPRPGPEIETAGLDIEFYCVSKYGNDAHAAMGDRWDAYSWFCQRENSPLGGIDMQEACRMQHPSLPNAIMGDRWDAYSWYCTH